LFKKETARYTKKMEGIAERPKKIKKTRPESNRVYLSKLALRS
jgi:hypothetical protein